MFLQIQSKHRVRLQTFGVFKVFKLLMSYISDMLPSFKQERRTGKLEIAERAVTGRKREKEKRRVVLTEQTRVIPSGPGCRDTILPNGQISRGSSLSEPTQNPRLGVDAAGLESI